MTVPLLFAPRPAELVGRFALRLVGKRIDDAEVAVEHHRMRHRTVRIDGVERVIYDQSQCMTRINFTVERGFVVAVSLG